MCSQQLLSPFFFLLSCFKLLLLEVVVKPTYNISKQWWAEIGMFDKEFKEYGMENLELSLRCWLCGGDIVLAKKSVMGHVFTEDFMYPTSEAALGMNKIRAIELWVDEGRKEVFYEHNVEYRDTKKDLTSFSDMDALKTRLGCQPFEFFVNHFIDQLQMNGNVDLDRFSLSNLEYCLEAADTIRLNPCIESKEQEWAWIFGTGLFNPSRGKCLAFRTVVETELVLVDCVKKDVAQEWSLHDGRLQWGSLCVVAEHHVLDWIPCDSERALLSANKWSITHT